MANEKISEMTAATTFASGDVFPIVQGGVNKQADFDLLPVGFPTGAKIYTAKLTQSGTNNPTTVILQNSIGEITWTKSEETGEMYGILPENVDTNKIFISWASPSNQRNIACTFNDGENRIDISQVQINFNDLVYEGVNTIVGMYLEIRVYP